MVVARRHRTSNENISELLVQRQRNVLNPRIMLIATRIKTFSRQAREFYDHLFKTGKGSTEER
jgi:hypothetical protein